MKSGIARTRESRKRIVACSGGDVGGYLRSRCGARASSACSALACGILSRITGSALDEMYCMPILDLDACQCVRVLEHAARIYQTLSVSGYICVFRR